MLAGVGVRSGKGFSTRMGAALAKSGAGNSLIGKQLSTIAGGMNKSLAPVKESMDRFSASVGNKITPVAASASAFSSASSSVSSGTNPEASPIQNNTASGGDPFKYSTQVTPDILPASAMQYVEAAPGFLGLPPKIGGIYTKWIVAGVAVVVLLSVLKGGKS